MKLKKPDNSFKQKLSQGVQMMGVWNGIANTTVAEILACSGIDFICVDAEHGPFDVPSTLLQLQALQPYEVNHLVRLPVGETSLIKKYLDIGSENLLIPMVETAEQAESIVAATRYPPAGVRGVGTALARAARWNNYEDYFRRANEDICIILQVESKKGLENLDSICGVDGVNAVFIGPADLGASLGYLGQPSHPLVVELVSAAIKKITTHKLKAGVLTTDPLLMKSYIKSGATVLGISLDTILLSKAVQECVKMFKSD